MKGPSLLDVEGVHVVSLYGSWHEMGRQYGSLAKNYMTDVLEYVDSRLAGDAARIADAREIAGPCHGLTRYQIVAVPEDMTLHIFLPYCQKWVEFNLKWV